MDKILDLLPMDISTFPCPSTSSLQTLVDDNDLRVIYSDGWFKGGLPGLECGGTTHSSNGPNATAILSFNGTGVQVYGTVGGAAPQSKDSVSSASTYQVDDLPASTFVFLGSKQINYRTQIYASPLLSPGNHTLLITALQGNDVWLDYILYYSSNESVPNSSETSNPSSAPSSSETPGPSSAANTTHKAPPDVGIVGGVLGSVVAILLVLILVLLRGRKHILRSKSDIPTPASDLQMVKG
ncbi:hypothetical protein BDP27DRAFT_675697 [Rhodocollybia butyracea]|uniref:Uncharacterized protein n=1 Tax=Rhodocollybia butyracea TaxID=206335 RepID=A0A9P5TX51_9AGAR|nr:hypothetical protein BDP27DRAFT_675697 [Rhodocollybia butyracea]